MVEGRRSRMGEDRGIGKRRGRRIKKVERWEEEEWERGG